MPLVVSHASSGPEIAPCTADEVGVPAQVLRRRVDHHVGAERQRLLQGGRRERVVDHDEGPGGVSEAGEPGDVGDPQHRIARGLDPHDAHGTLIERCLDRGEVAHVHDTHPDAPRTQDPRDEPVRPAIHVAAEQHLVAGLEHGPQQRVFGSEAGRERQRVPAAFDRGQLLLERGARRVAAAPVLVAAAEAADAVLRERRREVDRRDDGARGRIERLTGVHRPGIEAAGGGGFGHEEDPSSRVAVGVPIS
jgi:hypothetical protein